MTDGTTRNQYIFEQMKNRIAAAGLLISLESMDKETFYLDVTLSDAQRTVMKVSFHPSYRMIFLLVTYKSPSIKNELVLLRLINMMNFDLSTCFYTRRPYIPWVELHSSLFVAGETLDEPSFDLTLHEFVHEGHLLSPLLYRRIRKSENIVEAYGSYVDTIDRPFWYDLVKSYRTSQ